MKHDVTVALLNWNGNLLATLLPKGPVSGNLRLKQYQKHLDSHERFEIAKSIVLEKVRESLNLLLELSKYYQELDADHIQRLFEKERIESNDLSSLMTYEGRTAQIYWDCLSTVFNLLYPEFRFQSRKNKSYSWNMNASDEINALLNYGYAILESVVRKMVNAVGLEPSVGFLHETTATKMPLVYDIEELYRWLVDLSVIQLLEGRKLKKSDFIVTENFNIRLKENVAKLLIEKIRVNFNRRTAFKAKNFTYESILFENVRLLADYILGKARELNFNIPSIIAERKDTADVKDMILNMTAQERRQLGINKSTLWYQQQNINKGKSIKIYAKVRQKLGTTDNADNP